MHGLQPASPQLWSILGKKQSTIKQTKTCTLKIARTVYWGKGHTENIS
jgi:hypothetical protein